MIIALAGRRIDAADAKVVRFPLTKAKKVKERLKVLLSSLRPEALISSAACGSDLLGLEVAGELAIPRSIVLPFDQALFKITSVTDRPGDWGSGYDRICSEVIKEDGLKVLHYDRDDDETYRKSNIDILQKAKELAVMHGSADLVAVIVWEGESKDENDTTEHFKNQAIKEGFDIKIIIIE
jgi:hypothetical protein